MRLIEFIHSFESVEKKIKKIEGRLSSMEETKDEIASLNETVKSIKVETEKANRRVEDILKEKENDETKDKKTALRAGVVSAITLTISLISLAVSIFNMSTSRMQLNTNKLANKTIISCEYDKETNELQIKRVRGISEEIYYSHFPFLVTIFGSLDNDQVMNSIYPHPIYTNIFGNAWYDGNASRHNDNILTVNLDDYNSTYVDMINDMAAHFQNKMAINMQLGHVLRIYYYDPVTQKNEEQYYLLMTNCIAYTKVKDLSFDFTFKEPGLYEISYEEADLIFKNECSLDFYSDSYPSVFEEYLLSQDWDYEWD